MSRTVSALARVVALSLALGSPALQGAVRGQADGGATCNPAWMPLGTGLTGGASLVHALANFDDGSGPALYSAGHFVLAGGVATNHIAKWNGTTWSALGSGMDYTVRALAVFDDGSGPALYAGGNFEAAGGVPAAGLARWNGAGWSEVGGGVHLPSGVGAYVLAMAAFDDGSGPALYVSGTFLTAGTVEADDMARWDGTSWSPLGTGMSSISAFAEFDDGSGPALYAAGRIPTSGGGFSFGIAQWNGSTWSSLGAVMNFGVNALAVFDDGGGPALYAGGSFTTVNGVAANRIAKWNGTSWSALGAGANGSIDCLEVVDDAGGSALYAGGLFTSAGGLNARKVARWDGSKWSKLGSGIGMPGQFVQSLAVFDAGSGPELVVGGQFTTAGGDEAHSIARWAFVPAPWTYLGSGLSGDLGIPQLMGSGALVVGSPLALKLTSAQPSSATVLFLSLMSTPVPFKGGTLVPAPPLFTILLMSSPAGDLDLAYPAWPPGASGLSIYFQYAVQDATAIHGVALSNAVRGDVP